MLKTRQTTIGKVQNIKSWSQQGDGGQTETVPQKNYGQTMSKMNSILDLGHWSA